MKEIRVWDRGWNKYEQDRTSHIKSSHHIISYLLIFPNISCVTLLYPQVSNHTRHHEAHAYSCIMPRYAQPLSRSFFLAWKSGAAQRPPAEARGGSGGPGKGWRMVKAACLKLSAFTCTCLHLTSPHTSSHITQIHPNSPNITQSYPILAGLPVTILMTDSTYSSFSAATFHLWKSFQLEQVYANICQHIRPNMTKALHYMTLSGFMIDVVQNWTKHTILNNRVGISGLHKQVFS